MPFAHRQHYRFPVFSPVRYENKDQTGYGSVTNFSVRGWCVSGSLPLAPGDVYRLMVTLPTQQTVSVAAGKVRWVRGETCGIETLVMSTESQEQLNVYLQARIQAL